MDGNTISQLLSPYTQGHQLQGKQLEQIAVYLDLLLKWNARTNLTAIRDPQQIMGRHFGESLFTAFHLFPDGKQEADVADIGSGAGFPGVPIAIVRPSVRVTLIEAHGKKATFLKEVVRTLKLPGATVFHGRAESYAGLGDVVTFRAVEHFATVLPIAARMVAPGGRLAALIGEEQVTALQQFTEVRWTETGTPKLCQTAT